MPAGCSSTRLAFFLARTRLRHGRSRVPFFRSKPELKLIIFWVEVYFHFGYIKGVPAPRIKADAANSFGYCFADPQTNNAGIYCTAFNADKSAPRVFKSVPNFYSSKLYTSSRFESSSG